LPNNTKTIDKNTLFRELKMMGFSDIKELSSTRFALLVAGNGTRLNSLKTVQNRLEKKFDVKYDRSTSLSSIGHLVIENKFLLTAKPKSRQGSASAGLDNEIMLVQEINNAVAESSKNTITIVFRHGNTKFELKGVTKAVGAGADTAGRKKSDVNIFSNNKPIPISLKKDNAENWESADSYWGATARKFIDYAVEKKQARLVQDGNIYKLEPNLAVKADMKEKENVVFGSDILPLRGAVIKRTFQKEDFKYDAKTDTLTISVSEIMRTLSDVHGPSDVWFLIRNDKTRLGSSIGYAGLRVLAVYQTRVNQNVLKLPRDVV
jgi:hypothetical protein